MAIDWGILRDPGAVDVAGNFARGYEIADKIISNVQEKHALGALAANPDDRNALAALYRANPAVASHMETMNEHRRAALQAAQDHERAVALGGMAAAGNPQGAQQAALASGDFDLAKTFGELDADTQKRAADFWSKAGPVAYKLSQMTDPAARQALWEQAKPILHSEGVNGDLLNRFDPTNNAQLEAAMATSQKIGDMIEQNKITWHQQGEQPSFATDSMGHPVGTQNPASSAQPPTVTDQKSYDAVPSGGHYLDPSGHMRVKGGQTGAPSGGFR